MKWIHWTEKEPENYQWILRYQGECSGAPLIGRQQYLRHEGLWECLKNDPHEIKRINYWIPIEEMPLPVQELSKDSEFRTGTHSYCMECKRTKLSLF